MVLKQTIKTTFKLREISFSWILELVNYKFKLNSRLKKGFKLYQV